MDCGNDCNETKTNLKLALDDLPEAHLRFIIAIMKEPVEPDGLGAIELLIALRKDARILSLLELAMIISSDDLDQLLFAAEDYYSEAATRRDISQ